MGPTSSVKTLELVSVTPGASYTERMARGKEGSAAEPRPWGVDSSFLGLQPGEPLNGQPDVIENETYALGVTGHRSASEALPMETTHSRWFVYLTFIK